MAGHGIRRCQPVASLKLDELGIETGRVRLRLWTYLRATDRTRLDLVAHGADRWRVRKAIALTVWFGIGPAARIKNPDDWPGSVLETIVSTSH